MKKDGEDIFKWEMVERMGVQIILETFNVGSVMWMTVMVGFVVFVSFIIIIFITIFVIILFS